MRVSGFDALEGIQDLRTGVQVATLIGKGARFLRGKERDWFGSTDLYLGMATPISYAALNIAGEARAMRTAIGTECWLTGEGRCI